MSYCEDFSHGLGVAYYRPDPSKAPAEWAEVFGRRTLNAMIANQPIQDVEYWARLAGSYAEIALEQRDQVRELAEETRDGNVHPFMRDIVNSIAAAHGIPTPKMGEDQ